MPDTAPQEQQTGSSASDLAAARERLSVSTPARKSLLDHLTDMASSMAFPAPNLFEQDAADLRVLLQAARRESDDSARFRALTALENDGRLWDFLTVCRRHDTPIRVGLDALISREPSLAARTAPGGASNG